MSSDVPGVEPLPTKIPDVYRVGKFSDTSLQAKLDEALKQVEPGHANAWLVVNLEGASAITTYRANEHWSIQAIGAIKWHGDTVPEGEIRLIGSW